MYSLGMHACMQDACMQEKEIQEFLQSTPISSNVQIKTYIQHMYNSCSVIQVFS